MRDTRYIHTFLRENRERLCLTAVFGCVPFLLCILYCAAYGGRLSDVYLPASYWNDELFYYKQVEGILRAGYPQGYFGFNESHARACSFGLWSPLLFLPWVIWGGLFGWSFCAPVLCNLVCVAVGLMIFAWLAVPDRGQSLVILAMAAVFTPFTRFILSSVAEAFLLSATLVYMGLFYAYGRGRKAGYLNGMLCLAVVLAMMRPYFCLLALLAMCASSERGVRGWLKSAGGAVLGLAGYYLMHYWLSAPYLFQNIGGGFLEALRQEGVAAGLKAFGAQTREAVYNLLGLLKDALRYGRQGGCLYGVFGLFGVSFLLILGRERGKGRGEIARRAAGMALIYVFMMAAIVYMYNIHNGDRHLLTFILLGVLFLGMYSGERMGAALKIFLTAAMAFFFLVRPGTDYDRGVPFGEETLRREIQGLSAALEEKMELSEGAFWENTVIWMSYDMVDGEVVAEQWQQLYALPAGFGINLCSQTYVMEHFEELHSRYIAAVPGGEAEERLAEEGAVFLAGNDNISIWDRGRAR